MDWLEKLLERIRNVARWLGEWIRRRIGLRPPSPPAAPCKPIPAVRGAPSPKAPIFIEWLYQCAAVPKPDFSVTVRRLTQVVFSADNAVSPCRIPADTLEYFDAGYDVTVTATSGNLSAPGGTSFKTVNPPPPQITVSKSGADVKVVGSGLQKNAKVTIDVRAGGRVSRVPLWTEKTDGLGGLNASLGAAFALAKFTEVGVGGAEDIPPNPGDEMVVTVNVDLVRPVTGSYGPHVSTFTWT